MFCPYCGNELVSQSRFCPHCGKGLAGAGTPFDQRQPPPGVELAQQAVAKLRDLRTVIRVGGGIALFALLLLPQVSCMGQSMTALGLLNLARDFDAMTGARDLFLWVWVLSVFGGAIWALASPNRLAGMGAGIVQLLFMARIAGSQGLQLALGAYIALLGFAVAAFAPKVTAFASGFATEKKEMENPPPTPSRTRSEEGKED